ncbi:DUF4260 domain-containing protein [Halobacillus karajensis]|uniref:DUF4260 domain-containing protein n=1 Tax=Halobacillus karajensis TaxID=195088 RepID=UPI00055027A1|nr:DUF4260 domain-containing protein [Halobacillus karajensis]
MAKQRLHPEGTIVLLADLYFYHILNFSWIVFALLLFTIDVSVLGYVIHEKAGSYIYNFFHSYLIPPILILISIQSSNDKLLMIGLIWMAHIGMDRMFGFSLKYPTGFKDTHFKKL